MLENAPNQHDSNPGEYDPLRQALLRPLQNRLAEQCIDVSPEEALQLTVQKIIHNGKRWMQQELADQGIDVSPDEAATIYWLRTIHRIMEPTDPHETT